MAKEIIDIYIEQGYEYEFLLDFNLSTGEDLENDYDCYFESESIGQKQFNVLSNTFQLTLSESDTLKLNDNLEPYVVYVKSTATQLFEKLLSGRIHLDKKKRT